MLRFFGFVAPCSAGYVWENPSGRRPNDNDERYAKGLFLKPSGGDFEGYYDPFVEEPALYRKFAILSPTEDAILAFASKYGDLTTVNEEAQAIGNSLWEWRRTIAEFRERVAIRDRLLGRPVTRKTQQKIAEDIAAFIEPLLMTVPVFMTAVTVNGAVDLRGRVFNLESVLTMQLVESVVERKNYHSCDHCGDPFELTPQINRADRIFCSDNCRVKAYQRRRKQAVSLRAKGTGLREIAKTLNSDVPTVKKWVGEIKKEK